MADADNNTQSGSPLPSAAVSDTSESAVSAAQSSAGAQADNILDKIFGGGDGSDGSESAPTDRNETAPQSPETSPDANLDADPNTPPAAAVEDTPGSTRPDPVDAILSRAQEAQLAEIVPALLKAGIPKETVSQWISKDTEGLIQWANGLQQNAGQPAKGKADSAPVDASIDLDALVKPMAELLGDDAAPHLSEFGKSIYTNSLKAYEKAHANWRTREFQPVFEHVSKLTNAVEQLMLRTARADSQTKYPNLSNKAQADQVDTKARKLFQTGDYESFDAAYDDACKLIFAPAAVKAQQEAVARNQKLKANGSMTSVSNTGKPKLTADQVSDHIASMAMNGKSEQEIMAWKASVGFRD